MEKLPNNLSDTSFCRIEKMAVRMNLAIVVAVIFMFVFNTTLIRAQEAIEGLSENATLMNYKASNGLQLKAVRAADTLTLPFIDDFSSTKIYTDANKWADKYVYINSTYAYNPLSIGVATFDALNENGLLYEKPDTILAVPSDTLTSLPIDLSNPRDSDIYLSFYYEPGGFGNKPEKGDSLMLDFYSPLTMAWKNHIWGAAGDTFRHNFRQVLIKIDSPEYLQKGFRFRYRNLTSFGISTVASDGKNFRNNSNWHIDYVRLDANRNDKDTAIQDVAFIKPMTSLILQYQSIPKDQFNAASKSILKSQMQVTYRNNDAEKTYGVFRYFEIKQLNSTNKPILLPDGKENILPNSTFELNRNFNNPFGTSPDSAVFEAKCYLTDTPADYKWNDTIRFNQVFSNYFAYDDGSPEKGYGMDNAQGYGKYAYRFTSFVADTLTDVQFYFNTIKWADDKKHYFKIGVWADTIDSKPGRLIFASDYFSTDSIKSKGFNKFITFPLDTFLVLKGKFYVGWIQTGDYFFMNVGYDMNNNSNSSTFSFFENRWVNSELNGSLMIRPVFGNAKIKKPSTITQKSKLSFQNPVDQSIKLGSDELQDFEQAQYTIYNIQGTKVMQSNYFDRNSIDVSSLSQGVYILILVQKNKSFAPVKFLIQR